MQVSAFLSLVVYFVRHIERSEKMQEKDFASSSFQAIIKSNEINFGEISFCEIDFGEFHFGEISFGEFYFVVLA